MLTKVGLVLYLVLNHSYEFPNYLGFRRDVARIGVARGRPYVRLPFHPSNLFTKI